LYFRKSKIKPGIIHSDNNKRFKKYFEFKHNPTILFYYNGNLLIKRAWHTNDIDDAHGFLLYGIMIREENKFLNILQNDLELDTHL